VEHLLSPTITVGEPIGQPPVAPYRIASFPDLIRPLQGALDSLADTFGGNFNQLRLTITDPTNKGMLGYAETQASGYVGERDQSSRTIFWGRKMISCLQTEKGTVTIDGILPYKPRSLNLDYYFIAEQETWRDYRVGPNGSLSEVTCRQMVRDIITAAFARNVLSIRDLENLAAPQPQPTLPMDLAPVGESPGVKLG